MSRERCPVSQALRNVASCVRFPSKHRSAALSSLPRGSAQHSLKCSPPTAASTQDPHHSGCSVFANASIHGLVFKVFLFFIYASLVSSGLYLAHFPSSNASDYGTCSTLTIPLRSRAYGCLWKAEPDSVTQKNLYYLSAFNPVVLRVRDYTTPTEPSRTEIHLWIRGGITQEPNVRIVIRWTGVAKYWGFHGRCWWDRSDKVKCTNLGFRQGFLNTNHHPNCAC